MNEKHSQTRECRGRDKSEHEKKASKVLSQPNECRGRDESGHSNKVSKATHSLESGGEGQAKTPNESVSTWHKISGDYMTE
jgi:hypothetical protein